MTIEQRQGYIRALLEEREKCERRGLWDRVEQITAQLGDAAKDAKLPAKRAEKRPAQAEVATR